MSEMVERVALALYCADVPLADGFNASIWNEGKPYVLPDGEVSDGASAFSGDHGKAYYRWMARAAIKAMRTPSKAMLDAVEAEEERRGYVASAYENMDAEAAWPIMIDAALEGSDG